MSSNAIDWPEALPLPLIGPRKILRPRNEIHTMESKRARVRRYHEDYLTVLDFEWHFTEDEFETFKDFFEADLANGEYPFVLSVTDPDDPTQAIVTDYGFFEGTYQFTRSDNLYRVAATVIVEEESVEAIPEPFVPGLCGVVIVNGGGTTFECYPLGVDYSENAMEPAGTDLVVIYNQDSPFAPHGEDFQTFSVGALVLGSPATYSKLLVMYYGNNPLAPFGDDFQSYTVGALVEGTPPADTQLTSFVFGNGP